MEFVLGRRLKIDQALVLRSLLWPGTCDTQRHTLTLLHWDVQTQDSSVILLVRPLLGTFP